MENVMTAPDNVVSFNIDSVDTNSAIVNWLKPEKNHSRLKAFNFIVTSSDGKYKGEFAVKNNADKTMETYKFLDIPSATEYTATIKTVCVFEHMRTVSEEVPLIFCTLPEPPTNLSLEARFPNSLTVKWDPPAGMTNFNSHRYRLSIESASIGYTAEYSLPGDKSTFVFSKLSDGEHFNVKVEYCVTPCKSDTETISAPLCGQFTTKPLAPTNFKLGSNQYEIIWSKSPSVKVSEYKLRYRSSEEGSKAEEIYIKEFSSEDSEINAVLKDLQPETLYKINIYAIVHDVNAKEVESKELHEKVIVKEDGLVLHEDDKMSVGAEFNRQNSVFAAQQ